MFSQKWHDRFLHLAKEIAQFSKDPSTKVGSIIVNKQRKVVSMGYNGFPSNIEDSLELLSDRLLKYKFMIHAEVNAIDNSASSVKDAILYVTHPCCPECANYVGESGIDTVIWREDEEFSKRWCTAEAVANLKKHNVNIIILK